MSTIKQLIQQYCPDGVEYKMLGEVFNMKAGIHISSNEISDKPNNSCCYPCYGGNGVRGFVSHANMIGPNPIIGRQGALCGNVQFAEGEYYATEHAVVVSPKIVNIDMRWAFYKLQEMDLNQYKTHGAQPGLAVGKLETLSIPVPPLPVQHKIVEILDKYTEVENELEAQLKAELQARRLQYSYYRDKLLDYKGKEGVEWKTLGEMGTFKRGKYFQKVDMQDNGVPCIHYGQIYTYYKTYADKTIKFVSEEVARKSTMIRPQSVIITLTSENVEDVCTPVAWIGNTDVAISGHSVGFETDMNPKFIAHYLKTTHFFQEKRKKARGAKVIEVKAEELAKFKIPVPPLAEQCRVVAILDRFEALVNDISQGIPAEIEARQQQYEYYRDRLLTFRRVGA